MTGGAERSQMLIGVSGIVVAAGGKARGRLSLIHAGPAVVLVVNMEPMLSGRQPGEQQRDHQCIRGCLPAPHHPQRRLTPVALIELIVAVSVAAPTVRVPTKRKLAKSKLRVVVDLKRKLHGEQEQSICAVCPGRKASSLKLQLQPGTMEVSYARPSRKLSLRELAMDVAVSIRRL